MKRLTLLLFSAVLTFAQPDPKQDQSDARQRAKAVRAMASQGQDAIPRIAPYLRDADTTVRLEAVKALDDIAGPKTVDALVEAARDNDPEIQIRAADGLVNVYLPGYLKTGISGTLRRAGDSIRAKFTDTNDQIIDAYVEVPAPVIQALGRMARVRRLEAYAWSSYPGYVDADKRLEFVCYDLLADYGRTLPEARRKYRA